MYSLLGVQDGRYSILGVQEGIIYLGCREVQSTWGAGRYSLLGVQKVRVRDGGYRVKTRYSLLVPKDRVHVLKGTVTDNLFPG